MPKPPPLLIIVPSTSDQIPVTTPANRCRQRGSGTDVLAGEKGPSPRTLMQKEALMSTDRKDLEDFLDRSLVGRYITGNTLEDLENRTYVNSKVISELLYILCDRGSLTEQDVKDLVLRSIF
jgi:hypothetical protein